jgi:tetratricopeptide (TPR) repeat protein
MSRFAAPILTVCLALALCFGPAGRAAGASLSRTEAVRLLDEANEAFRAATSALANDEAEARRLFGRSIGTFQRLIDEGGYQSAGLYYNVANAHMLSGDVGRAVLNYRRALRLDPTNATIRANLEAARAEVRSRIEPGADADLRSWLRFIPVAPVLWTGAALFAAGWLLALARLTDPRKRTPRWSAPACIAASLLCAGVVAASGWSTAAEGVIVAPEAVARRGPDAQGYAPAFSDPLRAGVELTIIEQRAGWTLIRLADGREAWLPADSLEPV